MTSMAMATSPAPANTTSERTIVPGSSNIPSGTSSSAGSGVAGGPRWPTPTDCPILIWMLSFNREYSPEEYESCYNIVAECVPHVKIKHNPPDPDSFRQLLMYMLPLLMMRHRRVPRAKWRDFSTQNGKHWIEQSAEDMAPNRFLQSMIGYHLTVDSSLCGMAMTQGAQKRVVNVGLGIKKLAVEPRGVSVADFVQSQAHKLTAQEQEFVKPELGDEVMLRRTCMLLACKQAYLGAIGQPIGFDYSRLSFNIPASSFTGDDIGLLGWEFRIYQARLGVMRRDQVVHEAYQCVCAFFRGTEETRFILYETEEELASWVQFLNIDQMIKVIPKLTA